MVLMLKDLPKFKDLTAEQKKMCNGRKFDFMLYPMGVRDKVKEYVKYKANSLSVSSIKDLIYPFNLVGGFLSKKYPNLKSFELEDMEEIEKTFEKYLMSNNKNLFYYKERTAFECMEKCKNYGTIFLHNLFLFSNPREKGFKMEEDIWYMDEIPFPVVQNPIKPVNTLRFLEINQAGMKKEFKEIVYYWLSCKRKLSTIQAMITPVKRISKWLSKTYSQVESLKDLTPDIIDEYICYLNTESTERVSFRKDISNLRTIFTDASFLFEDKNMGRLLMGDDYDGSTNGEPKYLKRAYSKGEIERRNNAAKLMMDKQMARVMVLQEMLHCRISEVLTLRVDGINRAEMILRIDRIKGDVSYDVAIDEDTLRLLDSSIAYTKDKYGDCEYVFVDDNAPHTPMKYSKIQYHFNKLNKKSEIKLDNGEPYGVGTHKIRHTIGQIMAEAGYDDFVIAAELGHRGIGAVDAYRKIGNKKMWENTAWYRQQCDQTLREILNKEKM